MSEHGGGEHGGGGGESGVIANLLAKISFATDTKGLEHLGHKLEGIKHLVEGLIAFKLVEGLAHLGERFAGLGESLESSALQAGLTTDSLQKLQYAASQNAISSQDASMGLVRLGRVMFQAQKGSKQAIETFARLGISKEQLDSFSDTKQAFLAVADGVNSLGTQQEKLGVTQQVFGRGGAKYLKLFAEGSQGIIALGERAERVGAIISHKSVENLAQFEDAASSVKLTLRAFLANFAGAFIPAITRGLRALEDAWGRNKDVVMATIGSLSDAIGLFGYAAMLTLQNLSEFVHRIIYGGKGIGGSLHGLLVIVTDTMKGIATAVGNSIGELISNGSFSVFLEAIKDLFVSVKDVGGDVAALFASLSRGLGVIAGVDTNGIDNTTNSLNALLAVLTGIVQIAGLAAGGIHSIFSGKFSAAAADAINASGLGNKLLGLDAPRMTLRQPNLLAAGMSATGAMSNIDLTQGAGAADPSGRMSAPMQISSTINVTAAPGMSTEQLAQKAADKNAANLAQMFRETRRDFATPLVY